MASETTSCKQTRTSLEPGQVFERNRDRLSKHVEIRFRLSQADAEEQVQDFFFRKVLQGRLLADLDSMPDRVYACLRTRLDYFVMKRLRHKNKTVAVPTEFFDAEPAEPVDDAAALDRRWAHDALLETLRRFIAWCRSHGRKDLWGILSDLVLVPAMRGDEIPRCESIARENGLRSGQQVRNRLVRIRSHLQAELLRTPPFRNVDGSALRDAFALLVEILSSDGSPRQDSGFLLDGLGELVAEHRQKHDVERSASLR